MVKIITNWSKGIVSGRLVEKRVDKQKSRNLIQVSGVSRHNVACGFF